MIRQFSTHINFLSKTVSFRHNLKETQKDFNVGITDLPVLKKFQQQTYGVQALVVTD